MLRKQKIPRLAISTALLVSAVIMVALGGVAHAEPKCAILAQGAVACPQSADGKSSLGAGSSDCYYYDPGDPRAGDNAAYPGWQKTSCDGDLFKNADVPGSVQGQPDQALTCTNGCGLLDKANLFINFFAGAVGIVATVSIIVGGIQYASAADDPQKVAKAKSRITNSIIALLAFLLLYAFVQYLVPGGILNQGL